MEKLTRKEFLIRLLMAAGVVLFVVYFRKVLDFTSTVIGIIYPFLIGMGIAYIWNLIMSLIEEQIFERFNNKFINKIKKPASMIISFLIIVLVIFLVLYLVIPQIYTSITVIGSSIPKLLDDFYNWIVETPNDSQLSVIIRNQIQNIANNWDNIQVRIIDFIRNNITGFLGSTFNVLNSLVSGVITAFTALVFSVYLLAGKEKIGRNLDQTMAAYLPKKTYNKIKYFFRVMNQKFSAFFKGETIDAIALGVLLYIVMTILRLPYAMTISVVVAVFAYIPIVGAFIGGAVGILMIAAVDFKQAVIFLIALLVVQQIEGNLIYPKLVGDSIGLPGIWTFAAVVVGGAVFGPLGMILFVPLAAGLYYILRADVKDKIEEKDIK